MKIKWCFAALLLLFATHAWAQGESIKIEAVVSQHPKTFCNPLNLDYRFMMIEGGAGIREAADPVVVPFRDKYLLFASKSSGYWYSGDFICWTHVIIPDSVLPIEDYAPAIFVHNDYVYYVGSTQGKAMLYRSASPETGCWEKVKEIYSYWDPAFYVEGDVLYLYYGCSSVTPIYAQALDLNTLQARSPVVACFNSDKKNHGWERTGEQNELERRPYIEGSWMTTHGGKYYLQYAAPGTEWKSYADGAYVGDTPLGPFRYLLGSPVSAKPAGFTGGAGHGCMFTAGGQWWKVATNSISVRHMFERRISFYPSGFDRDGFLFTHTYLGDYPLYRPGTSAAARRGNPGWMLLSGGRPVTVSSALPGYPARNAVDEESRTAWVAAGNEGEWMQIDLEHEASICAIQINYDEYGATWRGVSDKLYESYLIYASHDGTHWSVVVDRSAKRTDRPHDYIEFEKPFKARYIKWENCGYTISQQVSLRELRIFGLGGGRLPSRVDKVQLVRDAADLCKVHLIWSGSAHANGYVVRFGVAPDKLYSSYQVMDSTSLTLGSLNAFAPYYFAVDAYNENGIARGKHIYKP